VTARNPEQRALRQVAGRLQAVVRQRTRLINQLHHLMALAFPELALVAHDLAAGWVLELLHRYPTAPRLAQATADDLAAIPYLPEKHRTTLLDHARASIGSLTGTVVEELVRDQVRHLRDVKARQERLETLLVTTWRALPTPNHLDTIPGIGAVTAAVLTAFILDIDRFDTPGKLVAYFGVLPTEASSGIDREGQARAPRRYVMSRRGNDLVRRYLWLAALSAVRGNPAVRGLYARVVAKHPQQKAVAIGHAMRKLLHLVFAIWKTRRPFDPKHYSWDQPAHVAGRATDTPGHRARQRRAPNRSNRRGPRSLRPARALERPHPLPTRGWRSSSRTSRSNCRSHVCSTTWACPRIGREPDPNAGARARFTAATAAAGRSARIWTRTCTSASRRHAAARETSSTCGPRFTADPCGPPRSTWFARSGSNPRRPPEQGRGTVRNGCRGAPRNIGRGPIRSALRAGSVPPRRHHDDGGLKPLVTSAKGRLLKRWRLGSGTGTRRRFASIGPALWPPPARETVARKVVFC
jgi:transposase